MHGKKSSIFYFYELTSQNKSAASFLFWTFSFLIFIFVHFNVMVWVFCLSFPLYVVDFIVMYYISLPVFVCICALVLLTTVSLMTSRCMFLIYFHGYVFFLRTSTCLPVNLASLFDTHNNQLVLNSRATLPWEKSNLLLAFCQETRLIVDLSQVPQSLPDVLEVKQKASNRS